ncbi:MAG: hypothetical protein IJM57_08185 [Lachnospiraceae bacterium]|nr:hypothetical protein [Lachnospiraceae bacterium]
MKVCLLYADREALDSENYYDTASIIQDLGLNSLFSTSARKLVYEDGALKKLEKEDPFLTDTLRKVMMVPLTSEDEILFRQEIVADCLEAGTMIGELYRICAETIEKWNELGRTIWEKIRQGNPTLRLISEIRVMHLFCDSLAEIRGVLEKQEHLTSRGLTAFRDEFMKAFSKEREEYVRKGLNDISFYTSGLDQKDEGIDQNIQPRIVFECGLEDGLKFSSIRMEDVSSQSYKFAKHGGIVYKFRKYINSRMPNSFSVEDDGWLVTQSQQLEFGVVSYVIRKLKSVTDEFQSFFDRLRFQAAFYQAAVQMKLHMDRFGLEWCFPKVCDRRDLEFEELREFVMAIEQRVKVIGNTCSLRQKDMLIVTGANQGGKSTFLRSIGIAQVMMQCGLPVTAKSFRSGIFPRIFVHFTRREDSAMNSGRLDEELRRMDGIVEHIGDGSLILLNESFASTTEKEGSLIAYDILRALKEAGVRILTVTHLLSFAKRVYGESKDRPEAGVDFLSAERLPDGTRTFRMVRGEPELTSFGLDLYDEIVEKGLQNRGR